MEKNDYWESLHPKFAGWPLSCRHRNTIRYLNHLFGINTPEELAKINVSTLRAAPNFGKGSFQQLAKIMEDKGFPFEGVEVKTPVAYFGANIVAPVLQYGPM
jgi:hypothetical protein